MIRKNNGIELNSKLNLQTYLNELYHESENLVNQIQEEINKLSNSTSLSQSTIEEKSDYAKAINSLMTNKINVLKIKLDINKVAAEILKFGGDENGALNALNKNKALNTQAINVKDIQEMLKNKKPSEIKLETETDVVTYKLNKNKL
jgi:DNA-binding ferritin-like protein